MGDERANVRLYSIPTVVLPRRDLLLSQPDCFLVCLLRCLWSIFSVAIPPGARLGTPPAREHLPADALSWCAPSDSLGCYRRALRADS